MGIPYYFSYLIKNHSTIISTLDTLHNIHNLFIDSNSLIYDSINFDKFENSSQFEDYIIQNVLSKIEDIIHIINPSENIYIAFDGVPPFAKINQQKNRRYKSAYQNKIFNKKIVWDTCAITPGTLFMTKLNEAIASHFNKNFFNLQNKQINILLSLSNEHGEGEHKLFNYIRESTTISQKNNVIYGMDADLFMLSLNHLKHTQNIYLYRETPLFINQLDKSLNPDKKYIININYLGAIIVNELSNETIINNIKNSYNSNYYNKIEDYIFICFLLGNDFLPHFPALNIRLNGFTVLLELYKKLFKESEFLIVNNSINWNNFKKYIKNIAEHEETFIKEIYNIREKQSKKFYPETNSEEIEFKYSCIPSWERNIENFINPFEEDWQHRYYYSLCAIDSNKNDYTKNLEALCTNYLETLQWVYYYYSSPCKNWTLYFKYNYPPLLCDLYAYIPYFNSEFAMSENYNILNDKLLLCYVLPINSLNLLPDKIHNYLLKEYKEHYNSDYEIIYAFCKYFYEGHIHFPKINIEEFNNKIMQLL
jgi:5'-3' exonuclease